MQPKSNNLFHFTRSIDNLKGILLNGFLPRYSLEDSRAIDIDYCGYPMVCFCDIPISRIGDHTSFYGEYGLGMAKEWGLKNKLEPLLYAPPTGMLSSFAKFLFSNLTPNDQPESEDLAALKKELREHFLSLVPMIKPISGTTLVAGKPVEKDFSQENEWRYVPPYAKVLFAKDFEKSKDESNANVAEHKLNFSPADVRYIFVKADHEIPDVFDFVQTNLGRFPLTDIKILISRITSLETLSLDV
jgi:Putative abortive phage resistance protein AbiGi, antitoxin